ASVLGRCLITAAETAARPNPVVPKPSCASSAVPRTQLKLRFGLLRSNRHESLQLPLSALIRPFWRLRFGPNRRLFEPEEHLARFGHQENPLGFAVRKFFKLNAARITITQVHPGANLRSNLRCHSHLGAAVLDAVFERAQAAHVCGMRKDTPWHVLE